MQKTITLLFISLLLFTFQYTAQAQAIALESKVENISKKRLGRYDTFLKNEVKEGNIPGAVSYVMLNGEVVHQKAYGLSSMNDNTPMQENQILHIMSMTKPIVSVAFMMLYEEGHFQLTDPVSKYLPEFKDLKVAADVNKGLDSPTVPAENKVTIHQILTHTAGFSHGLGGTELDNAIAKALYVDPQKNIESRVNTLVGLPLVSQPGEQWYYSASPDVLSLLIEHFSGMTSAEFLQIRLFDPLGMKDTGYNIPQEKHNRWGPVHNRNDEGKMVNSDQQLPIEGNTVYGGSHGLFSTATDYMVFSQMLLNKGIWKGRQYLSPKTVELMTMNQVGNLYQAPGQGFGLGFGITTDVAESKGLVPSVSIIGAVPIAPTFLSTLKKS
ncbi:serine hydrolase domain-containing protein [Aggregatimonas sangjinii]|uniref:serine hydrolase domain-containing protein n=1 Tax=Aggregatimonas sangjinii TaxID=2583587 RepID=UPI001F3E600B|nr:serine hydrolase domain-containing protein [Aggregatimonas sangjinii]